MRGLAYHRRTVQNAESDPSKGRLQSASPLIDTPVSRRDERPRSGRRGADIVGREDELRQVLAFLEVARMDGAALLITGEPGVGKTELLNAAASTASATGTRILRAAGVEFEAGISFSGLNQVLLPLLSGLPQLPAAQRDALNVALGFSHGGPPAQLVVSNAALVLLREAAASGPLLILIDDLQWLDRTSAGVLGFVARRVVGTPIGFLGAARTGEEDLFERSDLPELEVPPLDDGASRRLIDEHFSDLDPTVRERILIEAQGNPLALLELPAALGPGLRASGRDLPPSLPLGRRLQAVYRSRIAELPPRTRTLLLLMALDGTGDVRVLEAGAPRMAGSRDLEPAERARLAYLDAPTHRLAFHHPLIRSAVVELAPARDRRSAHRVLAGVWESQPDRRAWHLAEATIDPDEPVAAELEAAAARILARGDAVGCVRALTRASEVSPAIADRHRRLAAAAYISAEVAGDLGNASQVLAQVRRAGTELERSLQAAVAASVSLLQRDGDVATAHRVLVAAIEARKGPLDASDPVIAEALYALMMVCRYAGEPEWWRSFDTALARSDSVPLVLEVSSRTFADPTYAGPAAVKRLEYAISLLGDEPDPTQLVWIGRAATYVDRLERCRPGLWRLVRDARRGGAVAAGITAMFLLARDDLETGDWDQAERLAVEASDICDVHGYHALIWPCRYLEALVAAGRGEDDRVMRLTDDLISWTAPRGIRVGEWFVLQARALAAMGRGDFEEAYRLSATISPPGRLAPHDPAALYVLMDLVDAAVRTGRNAEAAAHVAAMHEANLEAISTRLALVVGGCAAIAATADEAAFRIFRETLALPGIARWQFHLARVRLAYGERLRRARAMVEARAELDAALEIFERLGARPWVARTAAESRATGRTKRRAGRDALDRLTPQEFEVAELAASGLTNKQIAERMFLSHRTVGGHLHRAFPKLGVATRAALRDALDSLPSERLPAGQRIAQRLPGRPRIGSSDARADPSDRARIGRRPGRNERHLRGSGVHLSG
jgi:DNA-binding CsgD family transcriptional regulator